MIIIIINALETASPPTSDEQTKHSLPFFFLPFPALISPNPCISMERTASADDDNPTLGSPFQRRSDTNEIDNPHLPVLEAAAGITESDDGMGALYQPLWVRLACILLDFLTQTYDQIRIVPEIVLFERWLCSYHFPQGYTHGMCKSHEIQVELARLRSWKALFDGVASR